MNNEQSTNNNQLNLGPLTATATQQWPTQLNRMARLNSTIVRQYKLLMYIGHHPIFRFQLIVEFCCAVLFNRVGHCWVAVAVGGPRLSWLLFVVCSLFIVHCSLTLVVVVWCCRRCLSYNSCWSLSSWIVVVVLVGVLLFVCCCCFGRGSKWNDGKFDLIGKQNAEHCHKKRDQWSRISAESLNSCRKYT